MIEGSFEIKKGGIMKAQRITFKYHGETFRLTPEIVNGKPYIDLDSLNITLPGVRQPRQRYQVEEPELPHRGTLEAMLSGISQESIRELGL